MTATATVEKESPQIEDVKEMPKVRRGRTAMDLSVFEDYLKDYQPHAIKGVESATDKSKWGARLRKVASDLGIEVETTWSKNDSALYFRGWPQGEAPARGRRSKATRKVAEKGTPKATAKATPKTTKSAAA